MPVILVTFQVTNGLVEIVKYLFVRSWHQALINVNGSNHFMR